MKVFITKFANRFTATAAELASGYKYRGFTRYYAWNMFVKDRGLRPELTSRQFYKIFDSVSASPIDKQCEVEFEATHMDTMLNLPCQVQDDERGVHYIVWSNGMSGSNPPCDTTFHERFVRLLTM